MSGLPAGLLWLLATLLPLLYFQRRLHKELTGVFLILTRNVGISILLFSIIFFPGVLLHEISHWVTARLLGVRTGKMWLLPEQIEDGKVRMGYVETGKTDLVRNALIGVAPLLAGGIFVGYASLYQLELQTLFGSQGLVGESVIDYVSTLYTKPDFWLWFYLIFVVSSTMMPSESDRQAWRPLGIFVGLILVLALLVGAGPWMLQTIAPLFTNLLQTAAVVFSVSVLVHLFLILPILLLSRVLSRLTGYRVV